MVTERHVAPVGPTSGKTSKTDKNSTFERNALRT
jgi:hypothetical protein